MRCRRPEAARGSPSHVTFGGRGSPPNAKELVGTSPGSAGLARLTPSAQGTRCCRSNGRGSYGVRSANFACGLSCEGFPSESDRTHHLLSASFQLAWGSLASRGGHLATKLNRPLRSSLGHDRPLPSLRCALPTPHIERAVRVRPAANGRRRPKMALAFAVLASLVAAAAAADASAALCCPASLPNVSPSTDRSLGASQPSSAFLAVFLLPRLPRMHSGPISAFSDISSKEGGTQTWPSKDSPVLTKLC